MTRALVTGSGGFVGRHLIAHLAGVGDEVSGVDLEVDVTDRTSIDAAMSQVRPDVVYHLAALTHVGDSWQRPADFIRVNVVGTTNVLEAALRHARDATVVVVSTAEVYGVVGVEDLPLDEEQPPHPANPYAQSKIEAERVARELSRRGLRVVIARPFNHIGPGQTPTFVVPALVERLLDARDHHEDSIPVGDLSTRRDFCDVRDVVRAYRLLATLGVSGEIYNVASGHDVAIVDLANWLVARIAPTVRLVETTELRRPVDIPVLRGGFTKLQLATGWEPTIALTTSLEDVVSDAERRRARWPLINTGDVTQPPAK